MNNTQGAMTERKQALQQLQDKVETGESDSFDEACDWFGTENTNNLIIAYNGSLDAALALHNAVLRGWAIHDMGNNSKSMGWTVVLASMGGIYASSHKGRKCRQEIPARAWLQAILSALIAEAGE